MPAALSPPFIWDIDLLYVPKCCIFSFFGEPLMNEDAMVGPAAGLGDAVPRACIGVAGKGAPVANTAIIIHSRLPYILC
ncbi:hypothetical protein ACOSP7_020796 [Xanthoceras sorbifolium]